MCIYYVFVEPNRAFVQFYKVFKDVVVNINFSSSKVDVEICQRRTMLNLNRFLLMFLIVSTSNILVSNAADATFDKYLESLIQ